MTDVEDIDVNADGIGAVGVQIERLTRGSSRTTVLMVAGEADGSYYLVGPDGKAVLTVPQPGWHAEEIESPAEMVKFIANRIDAGAFKNPALFYNENRVILVYDANDRRDNAKCRLVKSEQWETLKRVAGKPMPQRDFIRMLRVVFRNAVADSGLLNNIRNIQWTVNDGGQSNVQHGNESLGRQIVAKVQGVDVIPEEILLTIPVFENHGFKVLITCAIDIDVAAKSFAITPFPQELHNALENALDDILIGFTVEKFPPAFRGSPGGASAPSSCS